MSDTEHPDRWYSSATNLDTIEAMHPDYPGINPYVRPLVAEVRHLLAVVAERDAAIARVRRVADSPLNHAMLCGRVNSQSCFHPACSCWCHRYPDGVVGLMRHAHWSTGRSDRSQIALIARPSSAQVRQEQRGEHGVRTMSLYTAAVRSKHEPGPETDIHGEPICSTCGLQDTYPCAVVRLCDELDETRAVIARVQALCEEWESTIYKLPPSFPMTVDRFVGMWFKEPLRAGLSGPTDGGPQDLTLLAPTDGEADRG